MIDRSLLVMRGNSADMARHVMCQSPTKRISITFFKVRIDDNNNNCDKSPMSPKDPMTGALTVWQPGVVPNGTLDGYDIIPKWGAIRAPQLLMLAPIRPMVMSPRRLPRGGTEASESSIPEEDARSESLPCTMNSAVDFSTPSIAEVPTSIDDGSSFTARLATSRNKSDSFLKPVPNSFRSRRSPKLHKPPPMPLPLPSSDELILEVESSSSSPSLSG
ncbi:hypothetical protein Ccrd_017751 [Cynara cardunculus var. scolymus]|uniref:Oxoglutarate/iron-dependent dioxygenase n=1 Tax=Cynara cardunculus var. scolymus TaxID=59895 RepID=A0A118K285_CYNCS|nr:hypothetical protein Ccrd_017751 [Cynara cardunculus var. scolymus]